MFLDQLENMVNYYDLEEFGRICFCSVQSAPAYYTDQVQNTLKC